MTENTPQPTLLNNRYELEERLGSGGMSTVYRAHDRMLERAVAIKILRTELSSDPEFRERFRQEARAAANLSHPNIITVHDFGLEEDQLYIVMEYLPGVDLKTMLQKRGRFNLAEGIPLLVQACAGIGYAHRAGLVHCDIKPQNLLISPDRRLKVVDFGIARAMSTILPDEKADVVWGSPQYFSPEQASGSAPSPASDVYSLGVVMYEMLTGNLPFAATSSHELARLHREGAVPSPRRYNAEIPVSLEQIMLKVLSKEPSNRYRTADQLGRVLVTFSQHSGVTTAIPGAQNTRPSDIHAAPAYPHNPASSQRASQPAGIPIDTHPSSPVQALAPRQMRPVNTHPASAQPASHREKRAITNESILDRDKSPEIDWITWLLALFALITVGGLIPFWLWVYYAIQSPY